MRNEILYPFVPVPAGTKNLAVTTTTARVAITALSGVGRMQARIYNAGSVPVFVEVGDVTVVAVVASGMPIAPGATELITVPDAAGVARYVAGITASGTATLYITPGEGL